MGKEHIRENSMENLWNVWFTELHGQQVGLSIKVKRCIYSGESPYQRIDVLDTYEFGRMLVLYGSIMLTERDEFIYHEMISHVPLFVHLSPEKVLIVGGGDGGSLREALRHRGVKEVHLVEVDKMVIEISKRYFPTISTGFDDPRVCIFIEDGLTFLKRAKNSYDVIIVDSPDPIGPGERLFQKEFHRLVYKALKEDGVFVGQSESPLFHQRTIKLMYKNLRDIFPLVAMYMAYIPTYPSGLWSFAFCSKRYHPINDFDENRIRATNIYTNYYNPDVHRASFALPNFVEQLLKT
jgi:spermidine synthase